ncbi:hypothetical protein BU16DRAFT_525680 [Lophium mytilinum]|uniref:DUF7514 domain-containing protein n=1 Tax=Lophium mytilinum TaxID=390894 RepID=A0A6A6R2I7_9PEZI|nr:hypothetical protein BU16DRAFT_525680 [Lophium mytilinum]
MAYDGYRGPLNPPDQHSSQYAYDTTYDPRSYPTNPPSHHQNSNPAYYPPEPQSPRSRASSNTRSDGSQQPIYDAVNSAFDKSDAASRVDPDLIAQITAQVRKQVLDDLKSSGVGVNAAPQPPPTQHYPARSPTASTTASFPSRNVYTPPSPTRHDFESHGSNSPDPLRHDPMFDGAGDTPTPRQESTQPRHAYEPPSRTRPVTAARIPTDNGEATTVEKIWQPLFDSAGNPTARLGQFLRGLAIHIIDDYEPKKSLVISPAKMQKFYDDVRLSDEIYPWSTIFGKLPNSALSKMYRDMKCQHHLVQDEVHLVPNIPALTPDGFQEWMTAMIQAYPDTEHDRLSRAVLDMPISNADDAKERFPKELPRRLFPKHENLQAQQRCAAALSADGAVPLKKAPTFPPPPPLVPSVNASLERERSPYGGAAGHPSTSAIDTDEEDELPPSIPIERERQPYSAAPNGGRVFEEPAAMRSDTETHTRGHRSQSSASSNQWPPTSTRSTDYPPSTSRHHRTSSTLNGRRPRSPSFSNPATRSDTFIGDAPRYSASNIYESDEETRRFAKDAEAKRDWARRQAEEDSNPNRTRAESINGISYGGHDEYYRGRGANNAYDGAGAGRGYGASYNDRRY